MRCSTFPARIQTSYHVNGNITSCHCVNTVGCANWTVLLTVLC